MGQLALQGVARAIREAVLARAAAGPRTTDARTAVAITVAGAALAAGGRPVRAGEVEAFFRATVAVLIAEVAVCHAGRGLVIGAALPRRSEDARRVVSWPTTTSAPRRGGTGLRPLVGACHFHRAGIGFSFSTGTLLGWIRLHSTLRYTE